MRRRTTRNRRVVTTNNEKSAEVVVGRNTEGPNVLIAQAECMFLIIIRRRYRKNVNDRLSNTHMMIYKKAERKGAHKECLNY
ncbi:hypothetical protein KLP19_16865 [Clostridioides difficile]|nr:hypothetical protein [Clostridioides difficile]HBH0464150.1 hypothetical protein [Clostridioides difficile]HBH0479151.1 hypothetical protein [Clostridioides difficile]